DDALISLMRYQPGHVISGEIVTLHNLCSYVCHIGNSEFKYRLPLLINIVLFISYSFHSSGSARATRFLVQVLPAIAITFEYSINNSITGIIWLQQHRAGTISKDDTGGTIFIVHNRTHFIATYHNYFFTATSLDKLSSCCKCV